MSRSGRQSKALKWLESWNFVQVALTISGVLVFDVTRWRWMKRQGKACTGSFGMSGTAPRYMRRVGGRGRVGAEWRGLVGCKSGGPQPECCADLELGRSRGDGVTRFVVDAGVALLMAGHRALVPARSQSGRADPAAVTGFVATLCSGAGGADRPARRRGAAGPPAPAADQAFGGRVLQRRAWDVARRLGSVDTGRAEYVALTLLQGACDGDTGRRAGG